MTFVFVILPGQVQHAAFQIAVVFITALAKETVFYQTHVRVIQLLTANTVTRKHNQIPMHQSSTKCSIVQL